MGKLLLTVGNGMMGDDGAGALLAQLLQKNSSPNWLVLHGGSAPENVLHQVRNYAPTEIVIVDATDMDLPPGCIRIIPEKSLENPLFFTTHTLPLTFLIEMIREVTPQLTFIGIQPETVAFGYPISGMVAQSVRMLSQKFLEDPEEWYKNIPVFEI